MEEEIIRNTNHVAKFGGKLTHIKKCTYKKKYIKSYEIKIFDVLHP